LKLKGT
jgi:hypothetical protein